MICLYKNGNFISSFMLVFALCSAECIIFKFLWTQRTFIQIQQWKQKNILWISSKLTIKTPERRQTTLNMFHTFGLFAVDFKRVSIFLGLIILEQSWALPLDAISLKCVYIWGVLNPCGFPKTVFCKERVLGPVPLT